MISEYCNVGNHDSFDASIGFSGGFSVDSCDDGDAAVDGIEGRFDGCLPDV